MADAKLASIPETRQEVSNLYAEWRDGKLSRQQLTAGTYVLSAIVGMFKTETDIEAIRLKLKLDGKQNRRGGVLVVPAAMSPEEWVKQAKAHQSNEYFEGLRKKFEEKHGQKFREH